MTTRIRKYTLDDGPTVVAMIDTLLEELGEERADCPRLDDDRLLAIWRELEHTLTVFGAEQDGACVGVITVVESFAFYANGRQGIINEMFVDPACRSRRIGAQLLDAVVAFGRERGWTRIDVAAPESERWARTRAFYRSRGFTFAGPKLKLVL